jgi:hypothetical protein
MDGGELRQSEKKIVGDFSDPSSGYRFVRALSPDNTIVTHTVVVVIQIPHPGKWPVQSDLIHAIPVPVTGYRNIRAVAPYDPMVTHTVVVVLQLPHPG